MVKSFSWINHSDIRVPSEFFHRDNGSPPPSAFLEVSISIVYSLVGRVVSFVAARFRLYYHGTYTSPSIPPFMYPTYSHKGILYMYTGSDTHVFLRQAGTHLLRHVFPVTVLISLIENTNTALTRTIDISSLHTPSRWNSATSMEIGLNWLVGEKEGGKKKKKKTAETRLIQDEMYVSYHWHVRRHVVRWEKTYIPDHKYQQEHLWRLTWIWKIVTRLLKLLGTVMSFGTSSYKEESVFDVTIAIISIECNKIRIFSLIYICHVFWLQIRLLRSK